MPYLNCPMFGGSYGTGGILLSWLLNISILVLIFLGIYFLLIKLGWIKSKFKS
ncbi:hypothetical protein J4403_04515 [Candidatus Woesearchaeota archaeon]|nr:hypothetical protein [Candidatus Woesearchaeota archaeon]